MFIKGFAFRFFPYFPLVRWCNVLEACKGTVKILAHFPTA